MLRTKWRMVGTLAVIWATCVLLGCSDGGYDRVPASGKVLIDSEPLKIGYVRFIPSGGGRPSTAEIGPDGGFDFGEEGVVVGKHKIEVIASEQLGNTGYRWHAPEKYASYSSSGLEEELSEPKSDIVLNLSWDGGKPFTVQGGPAEVDPKNLKNRQ